MNPSEDAGAAPSTTQRNPVLLTGEQYRASLRDGRTVYYRGERIEDITTHPATRGAVSQIAAIYDAQHTAEMRDVLSYVDADGHRVSTAWMLPRSGEDLVRRRAMAEYTARQSFGTYGRHMDMAPTTQVGALAEIGIFQRYSTELAANIPKFIRYAQDNNIMGGGVFVDPQGWRAKRHAGDQLGDDVQPDTGFPANLRITRRDASGFWVSGPKAVGTALPYVHECVVTSAPHKPKDETFWFLVPANSQGVTMVCRSSLADPDESRWQHHLSGRGDEIDVLVLFDDVFVPWERVFMVGEPDFMLNYGPIGNLEYWYMLTRMCVKAELIAAVIRMVVDTLNTTGIQLVRQQVAEVNQYALALRSFIYASEAQARLNDNGAMCPDINIVTAGRGVRDRAVPSDPQHTAGVVRTGLDDAVLTGRLRSTRDRHAYGVDARGPRSLGARQGDIVQPRMGPRQRWLRQSHGDVRKAQWLPAIPVEGTTIRRVRRRGRYRGGEALPRYRLNNNEMKSRPNTFPVAGGGRFIGARVSRVEDPRHLTGEALFTADVRLPRMTSACFVRSLEAHARIRSIDTQAARQLPGVIAVFTAADIQAAPLDHQIPNANLLHTPQPVLAIDKVRFVGEPLAVVVARDRYIAEDAVDLVIVDYEPLPVVTTPEAAMAADAPLLFDELGTNVLYDVTGRNGDVAAAFARADRTFTATYPGNRFVAAPMEGRAALADYKSGTGELTLWCSTQTPHLLRTKVAAVLTFPEHKLRVIAPEVGGGFGQKMSTYPEEAAIAATARKLGRPVSWVEDRVENLIAATHAKEQTITLEAAVASDGTLLALRATHIGDAGAYSVNNTSALIEPNVGALNLPGLYRLAAYEWRVVSVVTNRSPIGPYRAVGSTAGSAARDLFFAHIAGELGIDVSRFLRANMIRPEDMPYTSATGQTYDSGSYIAAMDKSLEMMDYPAFRAEQQRLRKKGRYVGIGIAPFVEATAWGSELAGMQGLYFPSFDNATVSIDPGGKITVRTSMAAHGQGHETAFAQIAADILGVDIADVTVQQGDTATAPYGMGTFASRSAVIGGGLADPRCARCSRQGDAPGRASARSRARGSRHRHRTYLCQGLTRDERQSCRDRRARPLGLVTALAGGRSSAHRHPVL